jgi:hypothetical protein
MAVMMLSRKAALAILAVAAAALAGWLALRDPGPPTLEEYLAYAPGRTLAPADYRIDGEPVFCGAAKLVLNTRLDDVAAAHPGFIILNPAIFDKLPKPVRLYAFGHECGHQLHGPSEEMADCYAVMRGEAQGWLDKAGVQTICNFWSIAQSANGHLPGPERCALMQRCFARAKRGG